MGGERARVRERERERERERGREAPRKFSCFGSERFSEFLRSERVELWPPPEKVSETFRSDRKKVRTDVRRRRRRRRPKLFRFCRL